MKGDKGVEWTQGRGERHTYCHCISIIHMYHLIFVADLITAVEFDPTGNYLATGDRSGRVVLFERNDDVSNNVG